MTDYDKTIEVMAKGIGDRIGNGQEEKYYTHAKAALAALQETMPEPEPDESAYDLLLARSFHWTKLKNLGK